MKKKFTYIFAGLAVVLGMSACVKDLDVTPIDPNLVLLDDPSFLFNKCYANLALAGNGGANGDCDIDGLDGGTTGFIRQLWNSNELTTDEAVCGWGDEGISSFVFNSYDASHPMLRGYYYRLYAGITYCNHYLEVASEHDATMTAEIRFLRALHYYLAMDAFGNIPFTVTVSSDLAEQYTREKVFAFLEEELKEIEKDLSEPRVKKDSEPGYGRVDKAAAWLLLARMYLNAKVYTGTERWSDAATYAKKVMDSPYDLNRSGNGGYSAYQLLFMADNGETSATTEAIFPILQDGLTTTSWGTTLFLIASTTNDEIITGTSEGWAGNRARRDLLLKFFPQGDAPNVDKDEMVVRAGDDRAIFWGIGRTLDVEDVSTFTNGFSVAKFNNLRSDGGSAHDSQFVDTDFFLLRAAEAWLTYAEATARANGGNVTAEGVKAINDLRSRANASTKNSYTLDEILDEWSREFYFEGRRRVDLVRYGYFGGNNNYNWQWKGGNYSGTSFEEYRNIFAIPTTDLTANEKLSQNDGYNK